jgi:hypothetical protein
LPSSVGGTGRDGSEPVMRRKLLETLLARVQASLIAAAFAEEGDVTTARQIAAEAGAFFACRESPRR